MFDLHFFITLRDHCHNHLLGSVELWYPDNDDDGDGDDDAVMMTWRLEGATLEELRWLAFEEVCPLFIQARRSARGLPGTKKLHK